MQRLADWLLCLFLWRSRPPRLTPPIGGQYAVIVQGNNGVEFARHAG